MRIGRIILICLILLFLGLQPAALNTVKAATCTTADEATIKADSLVTAGSDLTGNRAYTSSKCIVDPKISFAPFKVPTYEDLLSLYFDQNQPGEAATKEPIITRDATDNDIKLTGNTPHIYHIQGNLNIRNNLPGSALGIIFVDKTINIGPIPSDKLTGHDGLVLIAKQDVVIDPSVKAIDAVIIAGGYIYTAGAGCSRNSVPSTITLTVTGSLISLTDDHEVKFCRDNGGFTASEVVSYDPKYLVILRAIISDIVQRWTEITDEQEPPLITGNRCGNFVCDASENCSNCPQDCGSCSPPPGANQCPTDGLVSYWKADETGGSTLADSVDSATGTAFGTTITTGKLNNGRSFNGNGSGDYIELGSAANFNFGLSSFSFGGWVKTTDTANYKMVMMKGENNGGATVRYFNRINTSDGSMQGSIADGRNEANVTCSNVNLSDGRWHQMMTVIDRSSQTMLNYVDGSVACTKDISNIESVNPSTIKLRLGINGLRNNEQNFQGTMDEVGIWNRALSQSEIRKLYSQGEGITCP